MLPHRPLTSRPSTSRPRNPPHIVGSTPMGTSHIRPVSNKSNMAESNNPTFLTNVEPNLPVAITKTPYFTMINSLNNLTERQPAKQVLTIFDFWYHHHCVKGAFVRRRCL